LRFLEGRAVVVGCGALSFALVWWMWGSLNQVPVIHDEAAYLLQAKIFAAGNLTASARPLPDFFEQYHTFVRSVVAAKYPPGFSLLLVPGIWLGLPGIIPALLTASTTCLLFLLARRQLGGLVALLSVVLSNTSAIALRFNPSYSSEVATSFLFLAGWWALLQHWESGRTKWLLLLSLVVGFGAITRPLTMLAFALPAGVASLLSIRKHGAWRSIPFALAVAVAVLSFMFVLNQRITGSWTRSAHAEYARLYLPEDRMGFGETGKMPALPLSTEQHYFEDAVRSIHRNHTPSNLPSIATARLKFLAEDTWPTGIFGAALAAISILVVPIALGQLLWATVLTVFASYLLYASQPSWTLYYLELQPIFAFLTAAGALRVSQWLSGKLPQFKGHGPTRQTVMSMQATTLPPLPHQTGFLVLSVWLVGTSLVGLPVFRGEMTSLRHYHETFRQSLAALPSERSIVFVRYASKHHVDDSLVENDPDLDRAKTWIVHDRGSENARLLALAPDRTPYLYHEWREGDRVRGEISPLERVEVGAAYRHARQRPLSAVWTSEHHDSSW